MPRPEDQFFVMFPSETKKGIWIHDTRTIARNYLTTWFTLDIFSIVISVGLDLVTLGDSNSAARCVTRIGVAFEHSRRSFPRRAPSLTSWRLPLG